MVNTTETVKQTKAGRQLMLHLRLNSLHTFILVQEDNLGLSVEDFAVIHGLWWLMVVVTIVSRIWKMQV